MAGCVLNRFLILLAVSFCACGCIADYRIQSPHVSVVLAQGDGVELYQRIRLERRVPIVARHDWSFLTRDQVSKTLERTGPQTGVVLLVGEHPKNIFTMAAQSALAGPNSDIPWLAFKVRIFPNVGP